MSKVLRSCFLFFICFLVSLSAVSVSTVAKAEESTTVYEEIPYDYNTSSVISDLNGGIEVSEDLFVPTRYLENIFKDSFQNVLQGDFEFLQDIYVISFIENGYGTDSFGLYFYVYNPKNLTISADSVKNKIQFSVSAFEKKVLNSHFNKYGLTLIDKTENNLYYKFKVDGFSLPGYSQRYYAVSGIELLVGDDINAKEYTVGSVYFCKTTDGKTTISRKPLSTIDVDVTHVYYRTDDSVKGKGWSNQLSSCYFSLPKEFSFGNNPFGTLSEILAEFDLLYTKPILLLNNESVYSHFKFVRGLNVNSEQFNRVPLYRNLSFYFEDFSPSGEIAFDYQGFNCSYISAVREVFDELSWVLLDTTADFSNPEYYYPAEYLEAYFRDLDNRYFDLVEDVSFFEDNNISLCGFDYGYNERRYSISKNPEEGSVLGYDLIFDNKGFWADIAEFFGFNQTVTETGIAPLVRVEYSDLSLSDEQFSKKYYVSKGQVRGLKDELQLAGNKKEVWLFRYDCSEYYGSRVVVKDKNISNDEYDGLVCREPIYLGWDILSFSFEQEEIDSETQTKKIIKTTVPVVHDPEDVFSDLTRSKNDFPKSGCADYRSVLSTLGGLVLAAFVWLVVTKIKNAFRK